MEINHFFLTMEGKSLNVSKSKSVKAEFHTFKHCKNKKKYPMKRELEFLECQTWKWGEQKINGNVKHTRG